MPKQAASINRNNTVTNIIVIPTSKDSDWCSRIFGGTWVVLPPVTDDMTSIAIIGGTYDPETNQFTPPIEE